MVLVFMVMGIYNGTDQSDSNTNSEEQHACLADSALSILILMNPAFIFCRLIMQEWKLLKCRRRVYNSSVD